MEDKIADVKETEESAEFVLGENLAEIKDEKKKKKAIKKKTLIYILFLVVSAAVIVGMILFEDRSGEPVDGKVALTLLGQNIPFTLLSFFAFFIMVTADAIVFRLLVKKLNASCSMASCLKISLLGRYFDRITPWAIGGEPFQILYFKKSGLSSGDACAVTMARHIIRFFSTAVAVIAIMASSAAKLDINIYVLIAAILSVAGGLVIPTFMLVCAFRPVVGRRIASFFIRLLHKMKIIKDKEKAEGKVQKTVSEFLTGLKFLSANKSAIVLITLGALIELFAMTSVPYFVMRALGKTEAVYWTVFVLCLFVNYSSSFAPTPGGAGIAELSFYTIFGSVIGGGLLFWAVLFWRVCVFYVPVFTGFAVQATSTVKEIVRLKRFKK